MALMAEHWTLRQKAGVIFQNNTKKGPKRREGERKNLKGGLEKSLTPVLECLTLDFLCFVSICHPHTPPPHTNSLACHVNY